MSSKKITKVAAMVLVVAASAGTEKLFGQMGGSGGESSITSLESSVSAENIHAQDRFISDDLFEGRYPGLRGGELAAKYIATQFALDGLEPAGDNGTYFQQINFVGMKVVPEKTTFSLVPDSDSAAGVAPIRLRGIKLAFGDDYTVSNQMLTPVTTIDAPI